MTLQHPNEMQMAAWLDGQALPHESRAIEAHLAECEQCREMVSARRSFEQATSYNPATIEADPLRVHAILDRVLQEVTTELTIFVQDSDLVLADADWSVLPQMTAANFFSGLRQLANDLSQLEFLLPSLSCTASIHVENKTACVLLLSDSQSVRSVWKLDASGRLAITPTLGVYTLTGLVPGSRHEYAIETSDGSWQRLSCPVVDVANLFGAGRNRQWVRALARALAVGRVRAFDAMIKISQQDDPALANLKTMRGMMSQLFSALWKKVSQQVMTRGTEALTASDPDTQLAIDALPQEGVEAYAQSRARAWLLFKSGDLSAARASMAEAYRLAVESGVDRETVTQLAHEQEMLQSAETPALLDAPFAVFDQVWQMP